mmetsp:Transcript_2324/g.4605  ORF Transcript_2324/g.4605 Transcript_2324/m.4605 type:complete len:648 (+) Transcript_2324:103-2046(+)
MAARPRMEARAGPDKSAAWCAPPRTEDVDVFRVKLRTDMIQVVRDQHDMLQSWACQWERKSTAQLDEVVKLLGDLRTDVQDLKVASASRKENKSKYLSTKIDDLEKFGSILLSQPSGLLDQGKQEEKRPAQTPHGPHGHQDVRGFDAAEMFEAAAFEENFKELDGADPVEAGPTSSQRHQKHHLADHINHASDSLLEDPAIYFYHKLSEHFPALKTNAFCVSVANACMWLNSDDAEEPERTGPVASIVFHPLFEVLCMIVIFINTWTILWAADSNMRDLESSDSIGWLKVANSCFTIWYIIEITLKLIVHRLYFFINESRGWNILDTCLVAGGAFELAMTLLSDGDTTLVNPVIMRCLRLLKMVKILRVLRVIMFFKELRLMMKCVVGSVASLFWGTMMLFCFTMLFAIYFVQQMSNYLMDEGDLISDISRKKAYDYYGSVSIAMLSLFKGVSGGWDWNTCYPIIVETGAHNGALYILYILLVWISLTNIITSIFVEKALTFAQPTQEEVIFDLHAKDRETASVLKKLFRKGDLDGSSQLNNEEFMGCLKDQALADYLTFKGIEIKDAQAFFRMLASVSKEGEVDIKTIIGGLISLKGNASNIDMLSLSSWLSTIHHLQEDMIGEMATQRRLIVALMQHQQELQDQE